MNAEISNDSIRVFLSSTSRDLRPERDAIESAIRRMEMPFVGMEYFGSADKAPLEVCTNAVRRSSVYIGLIGFQYGEIIPNGKKSYTEYEYEVASSIGIPRLIYIKGEEAQVKPRDVETDEERRRKLHALRGRLSKQHTVSTFTGPAELASMVVADLHRLLGQRQARTVVVRETDYSQMPRVIIKRAEMALLAALQTLDALHRKEARGKITRSEAHERGREWFRSYRFRFDGDFCVWDSNRLTHWHSSEHFIGGIFRFSDYTFDEFFRQFLGKENGGTMKWVDQFSSDYLFRDDAFFTTARAKARANSWVRFNIAPFAYFKPWDWYVIVEAHNEVHEIPEDKVQEILTEFREKGWLVTPA